MENYLRYNSSAKNFNEALPLGNGTLGAVVYGGSDVDRISLNHDTLWAGKPGQAMVEGAYEANERAKKLILEGKNAEAQAEIEQNFTGPWVDPYLLLGTLYIKREGSRGEPENYRRSLDLEKALVNVCYSEDGIDFKREYFVSYPDNCMMIKFSSSAPVTYELWGDCVGKSSVNSMKDGLIFSGECPSYIMPEYYREAKEGPCVKYDGDGVKVTAVARISCDGEINYDRFNDQKLTVCDAREMIIYFCAETSFISFDKLPNKPTFEPCLQRADKLLEKSYEDIRSAHIADSSALYNKVTIDLGASASDDTTDARLRAENKDIGLIELLYNFGRYIAIASSRKGSKPICGQGIWNESYFPAWGSHYTTNINIQMDYWPMLMCDLAECNIPLIDFIEELSVNGEATAKHYYHADGFAVHHNSDLWAKTTPGGNKRPGGANFAYWLGGAWLCDHLFEHYEYTMDKEFLAERAYPIMKKAAQFYLSVLTEVNGRLILTPATSPENEFCMNDKYLSVCLYTAMNQQMLENLFRNIITGADILGIDDGFVKEIKAKLPKVAVYEIGSKGQLLEFDKEYEEKDIHHRHISHMYALYPASLISTKSAPELSEGVRRSLEIRGDDGCTGWGLAWRAALWAKLKEGDRALEMIKKQLHYVDSSVGKSKVAGGTYPNMFNACPPMQTDGSIGIVATITQLFLQCEDGKIKVLPALPAAIPNGKLFGIMAKGNVKLDIEWKDSSLSHLALLSPISQTLTVNVGGKDIEIALKANERYII